MIKKFAAMALAIALVGTSAIPAAEAGPRGRGYNNHGGDRDHGRHHRGRGHYKKANGLLSASSELQPLRPSPILIVAIATTGVAGGIAIESACRCCLGRVPAQAGALLMRHKLDEARCDATSEIRPTKVMPASAPRSARRAY